MKYVLASIAALALVGCATTQSEVKVPEKVLIEVPIPCKTPNPPAPDLRYLPPYETTFEGVRDLLGDREQMIAYENELLIALKSCR